MSALRFGAMLVMALLAAATARADDALRGTLTSVGSDTMSALLTAWSADFHARHPQVRVQTQAAGSASTPAALVEGAADLGSMSRPMSEAELGAFRARYGYEPLRIAVAHDAIAVFVHPDNPATRITLAQLDAIYSDTRRCGAPASADASGLSVLAANGRDASSGTYELFREIALCGGAYRADVVAWPGNGAVVAAVAGHRDMIGYAGAGYVNALVKPLAVARDAGSAAVLPSAANIASGRYPLARALYVYVNRKPGAPLAALPAAFLDYALSDAGQRLALRAGFVPLGKDESGAQRASLR